MIDAPQHQCFLDEDRAYTAAIDELIRILSSWKRQTKTRPEPATAEAGACDEEAT